MSSLAEQVFIFQHGFYFAEFGYIIYVFVMRRSISEHIRVVPNPVLLYADTMQDRT